MNFVESLSMFHVDAKEIPCVTEKGAPTEKTLGAPGVLYMDTDTGDLYKCRAADAVNKVYNWEKIGGGSSDYKLPIGGEQLGGVKNGGNVVINEDGTMTAPGSGSSQNVTIVEPAEDDIPKVFFGGPLQQTKDEKVVPFRYISKTQDISGYAEIKAQGNSSMSYPKKNQTVKLFKDAECTEKLKVDFKGWGKQNKHCYKANWIDLSHARNVVSARLWGDIVKSRANYAELPELLRTSPNQGAVDGFPVKVYAAGVYQGRYTMNIPKDKWMANMDDELDTHCILCGENYVSGCFRAAANINGSDWSDEIHDTVPASIKTRWNEVISFVMNSTDDDFKANLGQYFYVDSLIDYYLFGLASCGLDAFGKNQLYMTYDGQRWIATMYDMDSTWGLYYNGQRFVATDYGRNQYEDHVNSTGNLLYVRLEQLFYAELQTRWAELKNGALSMENIINRFERFTDIVPAELVKEDYASTTGGGRFTGIPSQSTNNIQQIREFALARQAWADEYVAGLTPEEAVPCTGITLDKTELTFTEAGTQTLTATVTPDGCTDKITWESDNTDIATVEGGVVTAITNGSANITARCGEYSAVCAVSVSGIAEVFNLLKNESFSYGSINGITGDAISGTDDIMTGSVDITAYRGQALKMIVDGRIGGGGQKIVFLDADEKFLYGAYTSESVIAGLVPSNAKYARFGVKAGATNVTVSLLEPSENKFSTDGSVLGSYYDGNNGTINDYADYTRNTMPTNGTGYLVIKNVVAGAFFTSENVYTGPITHNIGEDYRLAVVPENTEYVGFHWYTTKQNAVEIATTTDTVIGWMENTLS